MPRAQLIHATVAVALTAAVACSRAETNEQTQRAAAELKSAAARAGDSLADGWLTTKVQARYFADDQIKARYIDVTTRDGVVTIKGYVDSPATRERALQIARGTDGVKAVNDQLLIGQSPETFASADRPVATAGESSAPVTAGAKLDDAVITSSIQAKYFLDTAVKGRNIDVDTRNGIVTLAGEVGSEAERAQALLLARNTDGVQRVEDNLTVNAAVAQPAPAATASVESAVKARLAADGQLQASSIDVTANGGVVELQGTVASAAARQRALTLARETDGVTQVVDRLNVKQ